MTSAQIKNFVRRALREVVDPSPDKQTIDKIWAHFGCRCCYCDKRLNRSVKDGHIDHLLSASKGGANHVSNRVLACSQCNEKEKLDRDWREFLSEKCSGAMSDLSSRTARIEEWQQQTATDGGASIAELVKQADLMASEVNALIDQKYVELRALQKKRRPQAAAVKV